MSNITKTAMITVCGRPNVGKSSLTNALVGEKVAIVSNKAQTTRNRIYGIVNREDTQYILLDTPGLHKPKSALGDYMVKVVTSSLSDVDCALLLVEPIPHVGGPEKALIDRIREEKIPCILCINKIDTVEPAELLPVIAAYNEVWDGFDAIIPISAHKGGGLDDLMHELQKYAQEGPQLFPDGETTDQPERQVMGELLREKLLGLVQTQRCCEALVAALLAAVGADRDHPLEVRQEDIQAAMDGKLRAETSTDEENRVHRMIFREIREG